MDISVWFELPLGAEGAPREVCLGYAEDNREFRPETNGVLWDDRERVQQDPETARFVSTIRRRHAAAAMSFCIVVNDCLSAI